MGEKLGLNEIRDCLKNTHFPASRDELVHYAQDAHVSQNIVNAISSIPDREYSSAIDAAKTFVSSKLNLGRMMGRDSCDD
ncbi:MAG: DUF2795 domain-containing protein [Chitinispirillales bacterium]|jgi:hypothetical protein|nr:DUF2795 domain-containing protein [Chitinispirillales bacterium]